MLASVEKRLMAKYEHIIAQAERAEALLLRQQPQGAPAAWIVRTLRVPAYWDHGNNSVPVRREELQDAVRDLVAHEGIEPNSYEVNILSSPNEKAGRSACKPRRQRPRI